MLLGSLPFYITRVWCIACGHDCTAGCTEQSRHCSPWVGCIAVLRGKWGVGTLLLLSPSVAHFPTSTLCAHVTGPHGAESTLQLNSPVPLPLCKPRLLCPTQRDVLLFPGVLCLGKQDAASPLCSLSHLLSSAGEVHTD